MNHPLTLQNELTYSLEEVDSISIHARNGYVEIPDIHNVKEDKLKSSVLVEIPVDDASPVTCSTALLGCVQRLPDVKMSFNLKLAVLLFCIFPFGFYVNLGLFFVLKEKYFDELFMKVSRTSQFETPVFFSTFAFYPPGPIPYFLLALLTSTCLTAVLFLRPKDLFLNQDFMCWQCQLAKCFFRLPITGGAKVQVTGRRSGHRSGYRSQAIGQITGHKSGHRSDYRSCHRSHTKTIGHWTKLFLIDILLYKNKTSQGTSIIIFPVLNFTKFHT